MKKKSTTPTFDEDAPITQGDIDAGKLVLRHRVAGSVVRPNVPDSCDTAVRAKEKRDEQ